MNPFLLISYFLLWALVLLLAFLLLGAIRSLALQNWRLTTLESTSPTRLGRNGLRVGKKAPDFSIINSDGHEQAFHDYSGQEILLVFTQGGCSPCANIIPELNRLHGSGRIQVLGLHKGDVKSTVEWVQKVGAKFPALPHDGV